MAASQPSGLTARRGAQYFPTNAFNTYQTWWLYDAEQSERDLDMAAAIDLDLLRVFFSYEFWREEATDDITANAHLGRVTHFLDAAHARGIDILPVLFEPIGDDPIPENLRDRNVNTSFAVHSPSLHDVIIARNWDGYFASPRHFATRIAEHIRGHPAVPAIEVMNEPARRSQSPNRVDFTVDMMRAIRQADPDRLLTMGCKAIDINLQYTDPPLDIFQYHDNLPQTPQDFRSTAENARAVADDHGVPVWCTEWQRTLEEPPVEWLPNYQSLGPTVNDLLADGTLDGACAWGLMFKPAYIEGVRRLGRVNGIFHEDGTVFDLEGAEAVAGRSLNLEQRMEYPDWMANADFPFPEIPPDRRDTGGGQPNLSLALLLGGVAAVAYVSSRSRGRKK